MEQIQKVLLVFYCFALMKISTGNSLKKIGGELEGHHFRIAVAEQLSGMVYRRAPNGTVVGYSGSILDTLKWLAQRLQFTYTIVPSEMRMEPLPNGTWVGAYALLYNKEVDFIFAAVAVTPQSFTIADITTTVLEEPSVMLLPAPQQQPYFWTPVKPFSLSVWLLVFSAVVAICCSLFAISRLSLQQQKQPRNRHSGIVISNIKLIFGQGGFEGVEFRSPIKRLVLCGWILSVLVLANSYSSCFISFALTPRLEYLPETLEDLAYRSKLEPAVFESSATSKYMNAVKGPMKSLGDYLRRHPENFIKTLDIGYEKATTGCCAFIYPQFGLKYLIQADYKKTGYCRTTLSKKPLFWDFYVFVAQKGSPYTELLSREILNLKEVGLIKHSRKDFDLKTDKCTKLQPPKIRPLKLEDLASVFVILCIGIVLSIAALVGEILTKQKIKTAKKKRETRR